MRDKVEFPAEEENACTVVFEATEAAGVGLDRLYLGVKALGEGVGDRTPEISEQVHQMSFDGAGDFLHRLEFAAHGGVIPLREKTLAGGVVQLVPKLERIAEGVWLCGLW